LKSLTNYEVDAIGRPLVRLSLAKGMIAADFLGDPTGTRVGHAISRCSGEVETSNASNASDPLQEDRVALQTVVSAMVRKLVTIVGSGMGLGIDDHRRLFSPRGRSAVSIALVLGRGRQLLKPLATTTKAIPTGDDAELFLGSPELLAVGDRLALAE